MHKLSPPSIRHPQLPERLIPNASLERKLDGLADHGALIWIAAPPRSGKRTAVRAWLRHRMCASRWLNGHVASPTEAVLAELRSLAELREAEPAEEPMTIALETTRLEAAEIRRLEATVSDHPHLRLIVVDDRDDTVPPQAGRVPEVTASDLAFSAAAIAETATKMGINVPAALVSALSHHYGGNPALVGTVLGNWESSSHLAPDTVLAAAHAEELVALATKLVGEDALEFAALLALAGDVPRSTALDVLGEEHAETALRVLRERGLLALNESARGELLYRLPATVREYVRTATLPYYLVRRKSLHRRAADAAMRCGDLVEAVRLLTAGGDAHAGVELFVEHWAYLHQRGQWDRLLEAFAALDPDLVLENAVACAAGSIVTELCNRGLAIEPFEARVRSIGVAELAKFSLPQRTTVRVAQTLMAVRQGQVSGARRLVKQAFADHEASEPSERLASRYVYVELLLAGAYAALNFGELRAGLALCDEAFMLCDYEAAAVGLYRAECMRAFALAMSGEFAASKESVRRGLGLRRQHEEVADLSAAELLWAAGVIGIHTGTEEPDLTLTVTGKRDESIDAVRLYLKARARLAAGQSAEAIGILRSLLGSVKPPTKQVPLLRQFTVHALGLALLMTDRPGEALRALEDEKNNESHTPCMSRVRPFALIIQGLPREALAVTEECLARGVEHSLLSLPYVYIARAVAFEALQLPSSADDALQTALAMIVETGARVDLRSCLGESALPALQRVRSAVPSLAARAEPLLDGLTSADSTHPPRLVRITPRERVILGRLAGTETIPEIATTLYLSENTVKTHLRRIYAKLGVTSRLEAVDLASRWGILAQEGTDSSKG